MKVKIVSPVHVGTGSRYAKFDYLYRNKKVRIIDYEKAYMENARVRRLINNGRFDPNAASQYYKYEIEAFCDPDREILEHIKVLHSPYIPGSSIKGTVRTALLWKYLNDRDVKVKSDGELRKIEREFFGRTPHDDFMKFLLVRDTKPVFADNLAVYEISVLSEVTRENELYLHPKPFKIFVECLKPDTKLDVEIKIRGKESKYLEEWIDAVATFSKHVIGIEKEFFENRNADGKLDRLLSFIDVIESRLGSGDILLRLGFSTGWLWKTVGSLLTKDERIDLANRLRLNRRKKGKDFPKTRRVIKLDDEYTWLPGWIQIVV